MKCKSSKGENRVQQKQGHKTGFLRPSISLQVLFWEEDTCLIVQLAYTNSASSYSLTNPNLLNKCHRTSSGKKASECFLWFNWQYTN